MWQVFRYCLGLNFGDEYRVFDDIFALLHDDVEIRSGGKKIFITSFNQLKKALTNDAVCGKVQHQPQVELNCGIDFCPTLMAVSICRPTIVFLLWRNYLL